MAGTTARMEIKSSRSVRGRFVLTLVTCDLEHFLPPMNIGVLLTGVSTLSFYRDHSIGNNSYIQE